MSDSGIRLEQVSVVYHGTGVAAVRDLSVDVPRGGRLVLVGESGAGKTTVLRLLDGTIAPTNGVLLVEGRRFTETRRALMQHRRNLGMVLQDPMGSLDPRQIAVDAVAEPRIVLDGVGREAATDEARDLLADLGIDQTKAQRRPGNLSGGECQRVAVARAMIRRPRWILADEPTASLDRDVGQRLWGVLLELCKRFETGLVLATHDLESPALIEATVVVLKDGHVVEQREALGSLDELEHPYSRVLVDAMR